MIPRALRCPPPGSTLAVIAPAGPADAAGVAGVPALLAAHGFAARLYPSCHLDIGYLAGSDTQRLADLHAAYADDDIAGVLCLRGGYGSARLLERIDPRLLRASRKPLVGYSDITALHCLLDREGLVGLHAPMPASDLLHAGHEDDADALFTLLRQGLRKGAVLAPTLAEGALRLPGVAHGRLVGGNLSLLAALTGTPWQLDTRGRVLFIEDVGEASYRVDRLLLQLRLSGALAAAAGFVLGSFTDGDDAQAVVDEYLRPLGRPVLGGWPAGHGRPNRPLPLGVQVTLDAGAGTLALDEDALLP